MAPPKLGANHLNNSMFFVFVHSFNDDFDKYERMGKFCFMDLDKVFETPFWVELFDTIRRSDKEYLEKTYLNGRKTKVKK